MTPRAHHTERDAAAGVTSLRDTPQSEIPNPQSMILSLFPGIGLLDRAFEEAGYCVVRGPDPLWGGDIREFRPPAGHYWGVIGGPPCQDFSSLNRDRTWRSHGQTVNRDGPGSVTSADDPLRSHGVEMLGEFIRVVEAAQPEWWLAENVANVPHIDVAGYNHQRLDLDLAWFDEVGRRLRHIQFGSRSGRLLDIPRGRVTSQREPAALARDARDFRTLCRLQGLPDDFDLPGFTVGAKKRAVGNGVPLPMGRALAAAVSRAYNVTDQASHELQLRLDGTATPPDICRCGCGRPVTGRRRYYDESCRKRAQRHRDRAESRERKFA